MGELRSNPAGGYDYLPNITTYSGGAVARSGHRIERVEFADVVPLREGFERIADHLSSLRRPVQALCGIELRSPAPFTFEGFHEFNSEYTAILEGADLLLDGASPIARTNAVPLFAPPAGVGIFGYSFTAVAEERGWEATYVLSGVAEGSESDASDLVSPGGIDETAQAAKATRVISVLTHRRSLLQCEHLTPTEVSLYTSLRLAPDVERTTARALGASVHRGFRNYLAAPPVGAWAFEMDARRVAQVIHR